MKRWLSVKQAVAALNNAVSSKLIYRLVAQGKLAANKALGKILIDEESLLRLLEPLPVETPPPPQRPRGRPKKLLDDLW